MALVDKECICLNNVYILARIQKGWGGDSPEIFRGRVSLTKGQQDRQITIGTLTRENPPSTFCRIGQIDRAINVMCP
jgi:hypothetical protein